MTQPMIDRMDAGLDVVRTCRLALLAEGWIDGQAADAIGHALDIALGMLAEPREHLNLENAAPLRAVGASRSPKVPA